MDWKTTGQAAWRVIRWLFKATVVAAVLIALLVLVAGIREFVDLSKLSTQGANAWLIALGLVAAVALLYFLLRAIARVFFSTGSWQLFGADPVARLVALGIVTFFNPRAIVALVTVPVTVSIQLASELPRFLKQMVERNADATLPLDFVLARAAWLAENMGLELLRAANRLFDQLPIADLVVALALWAILGHLLSAATDTAGAGRMRVFTLLRGLSVQQQRIAALAVIFLVGIYLSTAAIVAIPWLADDKGPQSFTRDRLEKALAPLIPKPGDKEPAKTLPSDVAVQFKLIEDAIGEARTEAERAAKQAPFAAAPEALAALRRIAVNARNDRDRAAEYRNRLRDDFVDRRSQVVGEALAAFEAETAVPMNSQEQAFVFHSTQRSARDQIYNMERALRECERAIGDADKEFAVAANELSATLKRTDWSSFMGFIQMQERLRVLESVASSAARACRSQPAGGSLYVATLDPGVGWGPFAVVAQWLLRTRSQELALITGMFGFGLLGSAVVTFVRPRQGTVEQAEFGTVAGEVASIIARGMSAAIVVFLAVKGGLAIFTSGDTDPNAYVLFFTCLVGAVFSDSVWEWARKKLSDRLTTQPGGKPPAAKPKRGAAGSRQRGTT